MTPLSHEFVPWYLLLMHPGACWHKMLSDLYVLYLSFHLDIPVVQLRFVFCLGLLISLCVEPVAAYVEAGSDKFNALVLIVDNCIDNGNYALITF